MRGGEQPCPCDTASSHPEEAVFASSGKKEGLVVMWLDEIETRFLRDRIGEISWERREYVYDLHLIEELLSGARMGWAFHMSGRPKRLFTTYPAEAECIRLAIEEGHYVAPERFHQKRKDLAADWEARRRAQEEKNACDEAAKQRQRDEGRLAELRGEREVWVLLGGQP